MCPLAALVLQVTFTSFFGAISNILLLGQLTIALTLDPYQYNRD